MRGFALVRTADQWSRAVHEQTAIDPESGGVTLAWTAIDDSPEAPAPIPALQGGLAFDSGCRLYRSVPDEGRLERSLRRPGGVVEAPADFVDTAAAPLHAPAGLAIDEDDRLYVAEAGARQILVYDLWSRRLLRRIGTTTGAAPLARPVDVAARGGAIAALLAGPALLLRFRARSGPGAPVPVPGAGEARRIAFDPEGRLHALVGESVVPLERSADALEVGEASDIEFLPDGTLVVARRPGETFRTFRDGREGVSLSARGYDGLGVALTPDGRIGYWSEARGLRTAARARLRFRREGRVSTYRLDAGEFRTQWGRLFLDACIPDGTEVRVHCAAADEPPVGEIGSRPPANVPRPPRTGTPPLLPRALAPTAVEGRLHRRETGRELPWRRFEAGDAFETYETPIRAEAGRYLWVTLELRGNGRQAPRVRALRAERPSHDQLRRLPAVYSRDPEPADFLRRYLAMLDGTLTELDDRSVERHVLVDPRSAPAEILPWLASFVGLVLDERWPERAKRALIAEAVPLFRLRGTIWSLQRMLALLTGVQPRLIEHFRLRGAGGALLGEDPGGRPSGSVVGTTFRVGGEVGDEDGAGPARDAFQLHAHRFTVVVPRVLSAEQEAVVSHVLDVHRPAHTVVRVCSVGSGMRVGMGLHVELLATIGRTGGFRPLRAGEPLGGAAVLGRPEIGARLGTRRLGGETWVG